MRTALNNRDWLREVLLGHLMVFATGGLFQLFIFSFLPGFDYFASILYGYVACMMAFFFLWEYRRHCLKHGEHWILRTGWWDLFPMLAMPLAGGCWHCNFFGEHPTETTLAAVLLALSVGVEIRGIMNMDRRLTDAFIARLKRVRGSEAAYVASGVNYKSWNLTFAWVMLGMLLYNGGGQYSNSSFATHMMRLIFLAYSLGMLIVVGVRILRCNYWTHALLALPANGTFATFQRLGWVLAHLPWTFWTALPFLLAVIASAVFLGRNYWYVTMIIAFIHQLLVCGFFHAADRRSSRLWSWFATHPVYLLVVSFLFLVLLGTFLFELPFCYVPETAVKPLPLEVVNAEAEFVEDKALQEVKMVPMPLMDAFFTAASATCVTGLTTIDIEKLPFWGIAVLCMLVQFGGIGIMTVSSFFAVLTGQRLGLIGNCLVSGAAGDNRGRLAKRMIRSVMLLTLVIETIGTALFSIYLKKEAGLSAPAALGHGYFLTLNSFCNAGFAIYPGGFTRQGLCGWFPMATAAILVVAGGLGFGVMVNLWNHLFKDRVHPQPPQVRIVLWMTGILISFGTLVMLASEWTNGATIRKPKWPEKILTACFQTASCRSVGDEAIAPAAMNLPAQMIVRVLEFIGAAPESTGGGVRVTTIGVLAMLMWSVVKRRQDVTVGQSSISQATVRQAVSVFCLGVLMVLSGTLLLSFATLGTNITLSEISSEALAAASTVGYSHGIALSLNVFGKLVLVILMFVGRVGFLTVLSAASGASSASRIRYPKGRVMIG
ncbi:MAG: hypothetical protein MJ106_01445 [Lentisphaeria bacterium]|nr:hypothetical protein [Lentisphaeria bacterium]